MKIGIDLGHKCYPDTGAVGIVMIYQNILKEIKIIQFNSIL